jgi:hypothetical protein
MCASAKGNYLELLNDILFTCEYWQWAALNGHLHQPGRSLIAVLQELLVTAAQDLTSVDVSDAEDQLPLDELRIRKHKTVEWLQQYIAQVQASDQGTVVAPRQGT